LSIRFNGIARSITNGTQEPLEEEFIALGNAGGTTTTSGKEYLIGNFP
jgi:hypothetical protein